MECLSPPNKSFWMKHLLNHLLNELQNNSFYAILKKTVYVALLVTISPWIIGEKIKYT